MPCKGPIFLEIPSAGVQLLSSLVDGELHAAAATLREALYMW